MKISGRVLFSVFCLCIFLSLQALAQKTSKIIAKADKAFYNDESKNALGLYEQALAAQPDNIKVNYRLGLLYLQFRQPEKAITVLLQAVTLSPKYRPEYTLNLARAYHLNGNFEEAIARYQAALSQTDKRNEVEIIRLNKKITECVSGQNLRSQKSLTEIRTLQAPLNSAFADHVPLLYNNDKTLIFTSRRSNDPEKETDENIYESQGQNGTWSEPKALPNPVNTSNHDAATSVSADGSAVYIYRYNNGGDIYLVKQKGNSWSKPETLPEPINSDYYEPSFFITADNQYAFFASDRPEGFGGLDLYLTMRQPDGSWSEAMNLGSNVNTEYDEDAPFIAADGITLYFSSRGRNSMGGYDLFSSSSEVAAWSQAQNLGFPVNSPYDDIYLVTTIDGRQGYFSSDRVGGLGEKDIYGVTFRSEIATDSLIAEPEPVIAETGTAVQRLQTVLLRGQVLETGSKTPLAAQLVLTEKGLEPIYVTSDSLSGNYDLVLTKGKTYNLLVRKEGYFYVAEDISLPENFPKDTLDKAFFLKKIETGARLVLKDIFFEYNNATLTQNSREELDRLFGLMQENEEMRVEISGHTDSRGKAVYNQTLSLKRAQSVVNYLTEKGIAPDRMKAVGFGATKPIAPNTTEAGRQKNRRTEFKVL